MCKREPVQQKRSGSSRHQTPWLWQPDMDPEICEYGLFKPQRRQKLKDLGLYVLTIDLSQRALKSQRRDKWRKREGKTNSICQGDHNCQLRSISNQERGFILCFYVSVGQPNLIFFLFNMISILIHHTIVNIKLAFCADNTKYKHVCILFCKANCAIILIFY